MSPAQGSEYFMTPAEHLSRARTLVGHAEEALRTDSDAGYHAVGPAQVAKAHVAVAQEIDRQSTSAKVTAFNVGHAKSGVQPDHESMDAAANLARAHLPGYLGDWIADTLTQRHTLPALVGHQRQIASDVSTLVEQLIEHG
jgi:hypothetical protein